MHSSTIPPIRPEKTSKYGYPGITMYVNTKRPGLASSFPSSPIELAWYFTKNSYKIEGTLCMCLEQQSTHKSQEIVELKMFRLVTRSVIARRCYADAAKSAASGLKLRFALPHETLFNGEEVVQVNLPAKSGSIGILANHVPTVEQLTPGVVEVVKANETKKYFVSGGFAAVQPDSTLCVTAVEAFPLDSFSQDSVRSLLAEAEKNSKSQDEKTAGVASIQLEVLEKLQAALK
ncbi:ATP synthase subunit delta, mitochondrial [Nakaseomyces glabratus]|nr:ATP synthase subunit delta, mitochondrial [Nakaseomyces glabratus]KTB16516.1 ATP synthase subunit delta, mitochondrial [Nakaseomyces glabratus]